MSKTAIKLKAKRSGPPSSERIIEAARKLFVSLGYDGVSIDEIAREAGVSKPTIYSHFEGKEALFIAVMNEAALEIAAPLAETEATDTDIESALTAHARIYTRALLNPEALAMNRLFIAEAARVPDIARRYYELGPATVHASISEFLKARVRSGEIECQDCALAARIYASMIISPARLRLQLTPGQLVNWDEIDELSDVAVRLFLHGVKKPLPR